MREIKFRALAGVGKTWFYWDVYGDYPQGVYGGLSGPQQYTGLKDKDGVEIYEGDILLWEAGWMHPEMNGEIQWIENGYHFVQPEYDVKWLITRKSLSTAKIIGNIFEGVDK